MIDLTFLHALRDKLKGGNTRSIHLNVLPGRFATRMDLVNLNAVSNELSEKYLEVLFTQPNFEFKISFDNIELTTISEAEQKKLGLLSKRLNSLCAENEDNFKEHGIKTFGFGFPIIIKRSKIDPNKVIKAPLLIWNLDIQKSQNKINSWSLLRNKIKNEQGKIVDEDIHSINLNDILLSLIKTEENITIPQINEEFLADAIIELITICLDVLHSLNAYSKNTQEELSEKLSETKKEIPESSFLESITGNTPWIYFGGVFGLFRTQKESIITDIDRLIDNFSEFEFERFKVESFDTVPYSAIETDPSQQEILSNLGVESKQIIQGPPGTGKSQSLTALITNALANNLKCLVVCEKKTALEVIKNNLNRESNQLGGLSAVIEDITKDREAIVNSVRERISTLGVGQSFNSHQYNTIKNTIAGCAEVLNIQHQKLDKRIYHGNNWTKLVGKYLQSQKNAEPLLLKNLLDYKLFRFAEDGNELGDILQSLQQAKKLYEEVNTLTHPLDVLNDSVFSNSNVLGIKLEVENFSHHLVTAIPVLREQLKVQFNLSKSWQNEQYNLYADCVKTQIEKWMPVLCENYSIVADELPNTLPLEKDIHGIINKLEELDSSAEGLITDYQVCLETHYNLYYSSVKNEINEYLQFIEDKYNELGSYFFRNDKFANIIIGLFSLFSEKFKLIKENKPCIINKVDLIRTKHIEYSYFDHNYLEKEVIENLSVYVDNMQRLDKGLIAWYTTVPDIIKGYVSNLNSEDLHPAFSDRGAVVIIEEKFTTLKSDVGREYNISLDYTTSKNLQGIRTQITAVIRELKGIIDSLNSFRSFYYDYREKLDELVVSFREFQLYYETGNILQSKLKNPKGLLEMFISINQVEEDGKIILDNLDSFRDYYNWRKFFIQQNDLHQTVIKSVIQSNCKNWDSTFECWYLNWLLSVNEDDTLPKNDDLIGDLFKAKAEFTNLQIKSILDYWINKQLFSLRKAQQCGLNPVSLFNKKGNKGERRNSLRKIIQSDFELFTDFFPVVMVNPGVCSSILPLQEGLFDIVIFDEASQLRLEDTFAALIRGKIRIVSGDSQQMPPSSYFMGGNAILNPVEEEMDEEFTPYQIQSQKRNNDNALELAESESLLVYAENANYTSLHLKIHYRSQHPYLIDFSNHAFYGKRLLPMPAKVNYTPFHFIEVNGIYEDSVNKDEAKEVVNILLHQIKPLKNGKYPSVGVATFNLYQRNLILDEITSARQLNQEYDKKLSELEGELFVKNLENIQGDERDIIILSTTFGRKKDGSFSQHFGPIIQRNGYKLLNVIITRAKSEIFICTSIPLAHIQQYPVLLSQQKNNGRAILYAYLAYAKAINDGNHEIRSNILKQLYDNCDFKRYDLEYDSLGSESPFEDEVYYRLAERIGQNRIKQQYHIGGFRIDMVIESLQNDGPFIAIECDGAKFHSSNEAYAWDMFRQKQLEKYGFIFYRIWSTNWWYSPEKELKKLVDFIQSKDMPLC
jgi:very-short-patch-repair endonuclease